MARAWVVGAALLFVSSSVLAATPDETTTAKAAVARLTQEKTALKAELAKQQKQIDALVQLLKENGIDFPGEGGAGAVEAAATSKKSWLVRIVTNEAAAGVDHGSELASARARSAELGRDLDRANEKLRQTTPRRPYYDGTGPTWSENDNYLKARLEVSRLENERRRAQQSAARAERSIRDGMNARVIVAQDPDGQTVDLTPMNDAAGQLMRGFEPGQWYELTGAGTSEKGALRIKVATSVRHPGPSAIGRKARSVDDDDAPVAPAGASIRGRSAAPDRGQREPLSGETPLFNERR